MTNPTLGVICRRLLQASRTKESEYNKNIPIPNGTYNDLYVDHTRSCVARGIPVLHIGYCLQSRLFLNLWRRTTLGIQQLFKLYPLKSRSHSLTIPFPSLLAIRTLMQFLNHTYVHIQDEELTKIDKHEEKTSEVREISEIRLVSRYIHDCKHAIGIRLNSK